MLSVVTFLIASFAAAFANPSHPSITVPIDQPYRALLQPALDALTGADDLVSDAGVEPGWAVTAELERSIAKLPAYPMRAPIPAEGVLFPGIFDYRTFAERALHVASGGGVVPFVRADLLIRFLIDENLPPNYADVRPRLGARLALNLITRDRHLRAAAQDAVLTSGIETTWIRQLVALSILRDVFADVLEAAGPRRGDLRRDLVRMALDPRVRRVLTEFARAPKVSPLKFKLPLRTEVRAQLDGTDLKARLRAYRCQDLL